MIFTTLKFLIFFVIVFLMYYIVPKKIQWIILLIASLYFYSCASIKYSIFLITATLITYLGGLIIENIENKRKKYIEENKENLSKDEKKLYNGKIENKKKFILTISIIATLSMLIIMKYTEFFIENISLIINKFNIQFNSPAWKFVLPLGISFYTFMSIGYMIDIYRGEYSAEKNFFKYLLFVSYFPHILQGPIDKYNEISTELFGEKKFDYEQSVKALYRIAVGVFKKMVIADKIAIILENVVQNIDQFYGINVSIAIILYAIQLYSDFSGYMDIAIGGSKLLGINIAENFDAPYFSKSVAEYWRRWHISLGAWFRDYLYYPLLRGKTSVKIRNYFKNKNNKYLMNNMPNVFALSIFWLLIGFWHGATWSYVLYGIYYGIIIIVSTLLTPVYNKFHEKFSKFAKSKIYGAFQILRTFCFILIGYFLFWLGDLKIAVNMFLNLFRNNFTMINIFSKVKIIDLFSILIGTIFIIILDIFTIKNINIYEKVKKLYFPFRWVIYIVFIYSIVLLAGGETQEFLYFQF